MSQKWQFHTKFFVPPYQFGRVGICAARPRCLRCGKCYTPGGTPRRIFRRSRRKRSIALFSSTKPRDWKAKNRFHPFLGQDARRTSQSSGQSQNAARAAADEVETISFSSDFRLDWFQSSNVEKIHQSSCCSSSSSLVIWSAAAPSSVWKHTRTHVYLSGHLFSTPTSCFAIHFSLMFAALSEHVQLRPLPQRRFRKHDLAALLLLFIAWLWEENGAAYRVGSFRSPSGIRG